MPRASDWVMPMTSGITTIERGKPGSQRRDGARMMWRALAAVVVVTAAGAAAAEETEIVVPALSPAAKSPGTAVICVSPFTRMPPMM